MLNNYNEIIYVRYRANIDIQLVNDPYGLAIYVGSYMVKSNATISKLLEDAHKDVNTSNRIYDKAKTSFFIATRFVLRNAYKIF